MIAAKVMNMVARLYKVRNSGMQRSLETGDKEGRGMSGTEWLDPEYAVLRIDELKEEIIKKDKELEMRNGIMNRQKTALENQRKETERLIEIIKNRERQIFDLYIKIFPGDAWVDAGQALMRIYEEGMSL